MSLKETVLSKLPDQHSLQEFEREAYKRNLFLFAKYCLGYSDLTHKTHFPIAAALMAKTKRKLICVPRGCFKSTITSISYPLWILINDPNARILVDTETYTLSKNLLREIKGHIMSDRFIKVFGNLMGNVWNESEITLNTRTKVYKEPSIAIGAIESSRVGQHYDHIIHDDLCSETNMMSEEVRAKVITHYRMNTAILEPHGTMVVIGTRYHDDDIIGHIIKSELDDETVRELRLG